MRTDACAYAQKNEVNKLKKRLYSALIVLTMVLSLLPMNMVFAETVASGSCGNNAMWSFDSSNNTLTISGSGYIKSMQKYSGSVVTVNPPWIAQKDLIQHVVIEDGIKGIGAWAFAETKNLISIKMPANMEYIDAYAFESCSSLEYVKIPEGISDLKYTFMHCTSLKGSLSIVGV